MPKLLIVIGGPGALVFTLKNISELKNNSMTLFKSLLLCVLLVGTSAKAAIPGPAELRTAVEFYLDNLAKSKDSAVFFNHLQIVSCVETALETKCVVDMDAVVLYHVSYAETLRSAQRVIGKHTITLDLIDAKWVVTKISRKE